MQKETQNLKKIKNIIRTSLLYTNKMHCDVIILFRTEFSNLQIPMCWLAQVVNL